MRLIIYAIIFLMISLVVNGEGDYLINYGNLVGIAIPYIPHTCSTAKFCGDYELGCEAYGDERCPENYGDWSYCDNNNYGMNCTPCDPDCGDCGQGLEMRVPNVNYPRGQIIIEVNASGEYNGQHRFELLREVTENNYGPVANVVVDCNNGCSLTFNVNISGDTCDIYNFRVVFRTSNGTYISSVDDRGMISPYIGIINPANNDVLTGEVNILSYAQCSEGTISVAGYYLCSESPCVRIVRRLAIFNEDVRNEVDYSYNWNTAIDINGNYYVSALVLAGKMGERGYYIENVNVNLNNAELVPDIEGTYQGSKILNIILARIKTWI